MTYAKVLKKVMDEATPTIGLSREEIEERIAHISAALKTPCGDAERIMLCAERKSLRLALEMAK